MTVTLLRSAARSAASTLVAIAALACGEVRLAQAEQPQERARGREADVRLAREQRREGAGIRARMSSKRPRLSNAWALGRLANGKRTSEKNNNRWIARRRRRAASGLRSRIRRKKCTLSGTWNDSSRVRMVSIWRAAGCFTRPSARRYVVEPIVSNIRFVSTIVSMRFGAPVQRVERAR